RCRTSPGPRYPAGRAVPAEPGTISIGRKVAKAPRAGDGAMSGPQASGIAADAFTAATLASASARRQSASARAWLTIRALAARSNPNILLFSLMTAPHVDFVACRVGSDGLDRIGLGLKIRTHGFQPVQSFQWVGGRFGPDGPDGLYFPTYARESVFLSLTHFMRARVRGTLQKTARQARQAQNGV